MAEEVRTQLSQTEIDEMTAKVKSIVDDEIIPQEHIFQQHDDESKALLGRYHHRFIDLKFTDLSQSQHTPKNR